MSRHIAGPVVERESVSATELGELGVDLSVDFPGCSADDFKRYLVLSEGGWYSVVKHQATLRSVARVPAGLLGPIVLASAGLDLG